MLSLLCWDVPAEENFRHHVDHVREFTVICNKPILPKPAAASWIYSHPRRANTPAQDFHE